MTLLRQPTARPTMARTTTDSLSETAASHQRMTATHLIYVVLIKPLFGYILDYFWTQNKENDLEWPNCCFTFGAFSKTIHQVKQLFCTLYVKNTNIR